MVDASVLAPALADDDQSGDTVRRRIASEALAAPELVDLEVISVLRRARRAGRLDDRRCAQAIADLRRLDLRRAPHLKLIERIWDLRDTLSAYDASYVALAELLGAPLVTADAKLARAKRITCDVELLRVASR